METLFQKPQSEWTDFEKRAFEEIQNICNRHDGDAEARYGAWEAMIWLSSQPEVQSKWEPSEEQMEALKCAIEDIARFSRRGGHQVEFENEPYYMALYSLYEHLKKLM